jgi:hypothetical protein
LIAAGAGVGAASSDGVTPLMAAAGAIRTIDGDPLACVAALLAAGANPNDLDHEGRTPLFYACGNGTFFDEPPDAFLPRALRLPDPFRGMRPNQIGNIGGRAFASRRFQEQRHGDVGRVGALLAAGANANATDGDGISVVMAAAGSADAQRLRLLLDAGTDVDYRGPEAGYALRAAAAGGDIEMFTMLLEAGAKQDRGLLSCAARSDCDAAEKVQLLLDLGADVEEPGRGGETPLLASLWWTSSTAAPVLLRAGANPRVRDKFGESTLLRAAECGPAAALQRLLELGLDPSERSKQSPHPTALMLAAESDRDAAEKVRCLLAAGADLEAKDDTGATALLVASRKGNMQAVVVLAEAGAAVNVIAGSRRRMTPLLYVANRGEEFDSFMCEETGERAARALILHGANVNATDAHGRTARRLAELIYHTEVLEVLDEFGG